MTPRSERRSEDVRGVFNKSWNDEFGSDRQPLEKESYLQEKHAQNAWTDDGCSRPYTEDIMTLFTQDYTEDGPLFQVTDVLSFCRGVSAGDLDDNSIPQRRAAWLHDTAAPTTRHNKNSRTAQRKNRRRKNKYQDGSTIQHGKQSETLDERAKGTYRLYDGPLSASELRNYLKEEVWQIHLFDTCSRFISSALDAYLVGTGP